MTYLVDCASAWRCACAQTLPAHACAPHVCSPYSCLCPLHWPPPPLPQHLAARLVNVIADAVPHGAAGTAHGQAVAVAKRLDVLMRHFIGTELAGEATWCWLRHCLAGHGVELCSDAFGERWGEVVKHL